MNMCNSEFNVDNGKAETHPATEFTKHSLVKPRIYHGREKRQISTTKEEGGGHTHHITVDYDLDGENYTLDLRLNRDLIPKGYFRRYQKDGGHVVDRPTQEDVELCHYQGTVRGRRDSWVAVSTCDGVLRGVIYDGADMHYIENTSDNAGHYLYRHSDISPNYSNKTCGYSGTSNGHQHHDEGTEFNRILRYKRSTGTLVRGPYNANKQSRYVELVLVVDNREYKELGESTKKVEQHCKEIANIINGLYAPLNIYIALVGVVIWAEYDEILFSPNGDVTLTNFLHYRREKLIKEHPNDNAQLLTKFTFENGVVGKALKGPICTYEYSGGVNTDHSPVLGLVATTVAHEMGHNFGMEHDTNECTCQEERCIMAPSSSTVPPTHWSSCSLEYLAVAFEHGMDYCLRNKPTALFDSPVCGNGFVEPGEQCDCGLPGHCDNTCCNATTCMLHRNASCATGECCDLTTCKPKNAGTLCRSADYECDLPEYCTGQSEYCPDDIYKMDTEVCDGGKAYCYHGFCRTRSDQCKLLWGNTGKSSDEQCYKMNTKGTRHGNCGYNKLNQSFFKCQDENVLCGMLHCRHLNERLEFGMESVAILSHSFINLKGSIIPCRTAIVDLGLNQVDPGLAPDGARCGDGKMCVNQKCMPVDSLRKTVGGCPKDCSGNGVCNSLGHCHCKDGFAPPYCDYPGPGGSADSGPASDPNAHQTFVNAMLIIFLGIIPMFAVLALISYYMKHNVRLAWKKSPTAYVLNPFAKLAGYVRSACNGYGKKTTSSPTVPTISQRVANRRDVEIKTTGLVSTTNRDMIDKSPSIGATTTRQQRFSLRRNIKSLRLNTAFKYSKGERSSPATCETICLEDGPASASVANLKNTKSPQKSRSPPFSPESPKKIAEDNHSLLAEQGPESPNEFFGQFKGFSLTPIKKLEKNEAVDPVRPAPPVPSVPNVQIKNPLNRSNKAQSNGGPPALPPLNPGAHPRPIISSPTLQNSTCTAKELLSPLRNAPKVPVRAAPEAPVATETKPTPEIVEEKKPKEKTINRIASFLKPAEKKPQVNTNSLPRNAGKLKNKSLDKEMLRSIEISSPIPQANIELPVKVLPVDAEETKAVVMRAQSMRGNENKPKLQSFGSMRDPSGLKRPVSIVGPRPKSPPPPRPQDTDKKSQNQYDDCLNGTTLPHINETNSPSSDNIYAVIEESATPSPESAKPVTSSSTSNESFGLLGEIVSEIQNRNFDSIYSTSSLGRKKKEDKEADDDIYVNAPGYKSPESVYSNMNNVKSSASSTSSGYIHPSAVNPPKPVEEEPSPPPKPALSSFKSDTAKPEISVKPTIAAKKTDPKPVGKVAPKVISRQTTPPNLRTRKPSPVRTAPAKTKPTANSPDLVTSCSTKTTVATKTPDVLNNGAKKTVPPKPKTVTKRVPPKTVERKVPGEKVKPNVTDTNATKVSNVAKLQQKFERQN